MREEEERSLQVRDIGVAEKFSDLAGLREDVDAVETRQRVNKAEVVIRGAAEDGERRQREARGELGVDGVGETDTAVAGGGRGGAGSGGETHGIGHCKGMERKKAKSEVELRGIRVLKWKMD